MHQRLHQIALVVRDYDEAIAFYTEKLAFRLVEDTRLTPEKRWVVVQPPGEDSCCLLLAKAANGEQLTRVGNQTGGRVFLFLHTDDLQRDHARLLREEIVIVRGPVEEPFGKVLVFEDLYGNLWDLIEPIKPA
ncbi:MAG: VOC family protein [Saprospiraceae bacterium]|jgi:catechol 2,3-dioxygenase-like lactoylglutathione lyase family enzyme|nr:VOC family protein [Saprospiraceae bacterium]MDP4999671.1 VOC family protein [Saprospiraceae bacterium]